MSDLTRRGFIQSVAAAGAAGALSPTVGAAAGTQGGLPAGPVVVSSANGLESVRKAGLMIDDGADTKKQQASRPRRR